MLSQCKSFKQEKVALIYIHAYIKIFNLDNICTVPKENHIIESLLKNSHKFFHKNVSISGVFTEGN